jgi:hypothetical protein
VIGKYSEFGPVLWISRSLALPLFHQPGETPVIARFASNPMTIRGGAVFNKRDWQLSAVIAEVA